MLEFMQPFDGTQPEVSQAEREEACQKINEITASLYARWPGRVRLKRDDPDEPGSRTEVLLLKDDPVPGHVLLFELRRFHLESSGSWHGHIIVRHIAREKGALATDQSHFYSPSIEGGVVRFDGPNMLPQTIGNRTDSLLKFLLDSEEDEPNRALEVQMGYNDQPVAPTELDDLHAALLFAEPLENATIATILFAGITR